MKEIIAWVRQPSTLVSLGLVLGALTYWFTRDAALALAAAAVPGVALDDHTRTLLERIEGVEDAVRRPKP